MHFSPMPTRRGALALLAGLSVSPALAATTTLNDVARYLAGMPVAFGSALEPLTQEPSWRAHAQQLNAAWARLDAEQLAKFKAEPSKYWPWFDGRCPVSVHNDAEKQMGKPQFGGVYRGRLVFFREEALRSEFARDPRTYMAGAR